MTLTSPRAARIGALLLSLTVAAACGAGAGRRPGDPAGAAALSSPTVPSAATGASSPLPPAASSEPTEDPAITSLLQQVDGDLGAVNGALDDDSTNTVQNGSAGDLP